MRRLALGLAFVAVSLTAQTSPFSGTWQRVPGEIADTFVFNVAGDRLTGVMVTSNDRRMLLAGQVIGADVAFEARNPLSPDAPFRRYRGRLTPAGLDLTLAQLIAQPAFPYAVPPDWKPGPPLRLRKASSDTELRLPATLQHTPLPPFRKLPTNGLARTPPMGWNSWNKFADAVNDVDVRAMADALVATGLRDAGYTYINIDDTWEGRRDAQGNIRANAKFPDMHALADYVHAKGLKLGIYSSPGPKTCAGYEGSYLHEAQDARTYAAWGVDYLKYDWCSGGLVYAAKEMPQAYEKMALALRATGRPIVFSICQYGELDVQSWGAAAGGNLWRTTGDISDHYDAMARNGFSQFALHGIAGPGHWTDPDMLEVGNGGMTAAEYRTHMSLWAMLAAPLLAGNDLRAMTPEVHDILANREVIAVDQDKLGTQGWRVWQSGPLEIWKRPLAGGSYAVAVFNQGTTAAKVAVRWSDLRMLHPRSLRDLWAHRDLGSATQECLASVEPRGVVLLRASFGVEEDPQ